MDHGQYKYPSHLLGKKMKDFKTGGPLTIHIVPHSHDDVGWLKTVDEYFDGLNKGTQYT